jgi:hypothetical protein
MDISALQAIHRMFWMCWLVKTYYFLPPLISACLETDHKNNKGIYFSAVMIVMILAAAGK